MLCLEPKAEKGLGSPTDVIAAFIVKFSLYYCIVFDSPTCLTSPHQMSQFSWTRPNYLHLLLSIYGAFISMHLSLSSKNYTHLKDKCLFYRMVSFESLRVKLVILYDFAKLTFISCPTSPHPPVHKTANRSDHSQKNGMRWSTISIGTHSLHLLPPLRDTCAFILE